MTPKEKATNLIKRYRDIFLRGQYLTFSEAKFLAKINVYELLDNEPTISVSTCIDEDKMIMMEWGKYWQEVINEMDLMT